MKPLQQLALQIPQLPAELCHIPRQPPAKAITIYWNGSPCFCTTLNLPHLKLTSDSWSPSQASATKAPQLQLRGCNNRLSRSVLLL
jgi:hypothetical protein